MPAISQLSYVHEDGVAWLLARVLAGDGEPMQQADLAAPGGATIKVFDTDDANTETHSETLVVADVVFDTLQTDARWTVDDTGYNLKVKLPATAFPTGDHTYKIEVKLTDPAGDVYWVDHRATAVSKITS